MQKPTYYIDGLFRQANAQYAREYLGITDLAGTGTVTHTVGDLTLDELVVGNGGPDIKTFLAPGDENLFLSGTTTPTWRDPAGGMAWGRYRFSTSTVSADPGSGKLRLNTGTWAAATNIYISSITEGGTDATAFFKMLRTADQIAIQDRGDNTKYARYQLTAGVTDNGGWFTIPVTVISSNGAVPGNNQQLGVVLFYGAGASGGGNVTTSVALDNHAIIVGSGATTEDVKDIAVGTTNTVLHGNTGADPSWSAVVEDDISLSDVTTNNSSTTKHGFLPKLNNNAVYYMDGTGNWSIPTGQSNIADTFEYRESLFSYASGQTNPVVLGTSASENGTKLAQTPTEFQLPYTRYRSGAASGSRAFAQDGNTGCRMSWITRTMWCITAANSSSVRYWVCMTAGSDTTLGNDTPTVVQVGFRYSTSASDPNWMAVFHNGSSTEAIDTFVAIDNNKMPRFELQWDGTNPILFYINGNLVAQSTLAMPAGSTLFRQLAGVETLEAVLKDIHIGMLKWRAKIPF